MYNTVSVIFFATRCYASAAYAVMRCPSVCLSVHLSRSWILSKRINISSVFSPLGSHIILVFPHQTSWQYSYGTAPNGGVECRWGRQKSRFSANIWLRCMLWKQPARCYEHGAAEPRQPNRGKLWHLPLVVSGGVRWWRETTTTKYLLQEASTLRQTQQNSI